MYSCGHTVVEHPGDKSMFLKIWLMTTNVLLLMVIYYIYLRISCKYNNHSHQSLLSILTFIYQAVLRICVRNCASMRVQVQFVSYLHAKFGCSSSVWEKSNGRQTTYDRQTRQDKTNRQQTKDPLNLLLFTTYLRQYQTQGFQNSFCSKDIRDNSASRFVYFFIPGSEYIIFLTVNSLSPPGTPCEALEQSRESCTVRQEFSRRLQEEIHHLCQNYL